MAWLTLLCQAPLVAADPLAPAAVPMLKISAASLTTASGQRTVTLPHQLESTDFAPAGSRVRYRTTVTLAEGAPAHSLYIPKMSRAGRVFLNGEDLGSCGPLALEALRCQHQPQFFRPAPAQWRTGENVIEVELYATRHQGNGLSTLWIGPTEPLFRDVFRPRELLQVGLIDALSWLTLGFGLLSLLFYLAFRKETLYLWFGLTCLSNVVSNLNILVTAPLVGFPLFNWLMLSSRLVYTCCLGLAFLAFYRRDRRWRVWSLLCYALVCPIVIGWFDNDLRLTSWLYLPLQLIAITLAGAALWWSWRSRKRADWAMALAFLVNPIAGALDLMRLRGQGSFEGVYLLVYTSSITLVVVGAGLIGLLALALRTSRDFSSLLEQRVSERETDLRTAYDRLLKLEQERARDDERQRLMRDMHDGFMSTLAMTRVALSTGRTSLAQAGRYLGDCIEDLRLVLDATGNASGSLRDLLADFRHRFESQLRGTDLNIAFEVDLDDMPELASSRLLQVMRIVQEALNNAVRHAMASTLRVTARWQSDSGTVTVEIADDGQGMPTTFTGRGRGLSNMRARAAALGATLEISAGNPGTRVSLSLTEALSATYPPVLASVASANRSNFHQQEP